MYEDLLNQLDKNKAKLDAKREAIEALPELEGVLYGSTFTDWVSLSFPYKHELFNANKETMTAAGFRFMHESHLDNGTYEQVYYSENHTDVTLYYRPEAEGSTCKRNLIGYKKPEPIYEVTCMDAEPLVEAP
jgi:hypothetical protein